MHRLFSLAPIVLGFGLLTTAEVPETHTLPQGRVPLRLVVASTGNEVRYRVREQLVQVDFPSDAVGVTQAITGGIEFAEDGSVVRERSRFVIDMTSLTSDSDRRDNYIRRRTLQMDSFPSVTLAPTAQRGFPSVPPATGSFQFTLVGDLTIRGVTRPTEWAVAAEAVAGGFKGTASTRFTFETFELTKPRVALVLSVADTITLEYDFHLVPTNR